MKKVFKKKKTYSRASPKVFIQSRRLINFFFMFVNAFS